MRRLVPLLWEMSIRGDRYNLIFIDAPVRESIRPVPSPQRRVVFPLRSISQSSLSCCCCFPVLLLPRRLGPRCFPPLSRGRFFPQRPFVDDSPYLSPGSEQFHSFTPPSRSIGLRRVPGVDAARPVAFFYYEGRSFGFLPLGASVTNDPAYSFRSEFPGKKLCSFQRLFNLPHCLSW